LRSRCPYKKETEAETASLDCGPGEHLRRCRGKKKEEESTPEAGERPDVGLKLPKKRGSQEAAPEINSFEKESDGKKNHGKRVLEE